MQIVIGPGNPRVKNPGPYPYPHPPVSVKHGSGFGGIRAKGSAGAMGSKTRVAGIVLVGGNQMMAGGNG